MFRFIAVLAFILLLSIASVAQRFGEVARDSASNTLPESGPRNLESQKRGSGPPGSSADMRISIARLREPRKVKQLYEQALNAWMKGRTAEAERKLEQALRIYPTFPEGLTLYGGIQFNVGKPEAAEQNLRAAIQSDPTYCPPYTLIAGLYNEGQRFDQALDATEDALSCGSNSWDVRYEMARSLIGKQEFERALTIAQIALLSKHGSLLHLAKAHALAGLKRYRQARAELRTYLKYQPQGAGSQNAQDMLLQIQSAIGE